jgi:hypothetical protein
VKKLLCTSKLSGAIRSVAKLASITFLSLALSYWIDYLGFITEGKLAAVLITPSLGVPNWSVVYIINTAPSVPPQGVDEPEGERQVHLAPSPKMGHKGGEPMLRGVGEPLLCRRALGFAHHIGGGTSRATSARSGEARGSRANRNRSANDGGSRLDRSHGGSGGGDRSSVGLQRPRRQVPPQQNLRRLRPQEPLDSSCCGCLAGGRACGTPAVLPPGP